MLINSKRGGATKIIVWIIILLVIIGAIYMGYKYISKDGSSNNQQGTTSGSSNVQDSIITGVNTPTSDTEKPPVPPE